MSVMRSVLLAASDNRWLRQQAPRMGFVKKAVTRFMPGERVEDALTAAAALKAQGIASVLTQLGENISDLGEAERVTHHYMDVLSRIRASGLDCQISIKLTQLGLDIDKERAFLNLRSLAERAHALGNRLWIDMEQHTYVDVTLELYRRVLAEFPNVGVCLQAYLYRTPTDLASLIPLGGGVRLVKGAYREPADVAYPKKADVDRAFVTLAKQMIAPEARAVGFRAVFGTHDQQIIRTIQEYAASSSTPSDAFEFDLLFGIQRAEQMRLAQAGYRIRVLISYGEYWFPWYMRRLAERPANVLFVAKSMFSS
jgi:proline dehydrogenase